MADGSTIGAVSELCNEVCSVLTDMENAGIMIDPKALTEVKLELQQEKRELEASLNATVREVMGDKPYSLTSNKDKMTILFSRNMTTEGTKVWCEEFNIGRYPNGTQKRRRYKAPTAIKKLAQGLMSFVPTHVMRQCPGCKGTGYVAKQRKDGTWGEARFICKVCNKVGIEYVPTKKLAGFRLKDPGFVQVGYNGYSVDKEALSFYIDSTDNLEAKAFMTKLIRLNAVNAYLSNYVDGIERRLMSDNRVHPKFNQTITATGRLSSSKPNFQNMPRAGTFPIKRSIVSRFDGGLILEGDFAQLEFRVAGYLAEDDLIREDVVNEVDVHTVTADIIFGPWEGEGKHPQRQDAKAHTFKPLYGGTTGTPDQTRYYKHFLENYDRVADWHEELKETALVDKSITLPSGRKLNYPYVKREPWGISHGTTIKNWPVQSYATADLLPISLVYLHNKLRGMKSMIINTVHDSIVLDVHPDEVDEVVEIFKEAMECLPDETERRFGVRYDMPVGYDVKLGENWMELEEVYETNG